MSSFLPETAVISGNFLTSSGVSSQNLVLNIEQIFIVINLNDWMYVYGQTLKILLILLTDTIL